MEKTRALRYVVAGCLLVVGAGAAPHAGPAAASSISATPDSFGSGQTVTVAGTGFVAGESVTIWFDRDSDVIQDADEPSVVAVANAAGTFSGATLVVTASPGAYFIRAGSPATAFAAVSIGSCLFQECEIDGRQVVCLLGHSPSDTISDCKSVDSSYTNRPGGYDFTNVGPRFAGAGVLAAAVNSLNFLGLPGPGCGAMVAAITEAESFPYLNSVPGKFDLFRPTQGLLNIACGPPFGPIGAVGFDLPTYLAVQAIAGHAADPAIADASVVVGIVAAAQASVLLPPPAPGPAGLLLVQLAMAKAAVAGALACGFVDYYCNGSDITANIMRSPGLQTKLMPVPFLGERWGDLIGWARVACTDNTMPPLKTDGSGQREVGNCEKTGNETMRAVPGSAGPDNLGAPIMCATGTVNGLSIGYDGDVSFDVNDGSISEQGVPTPGFATPNVAQLTNYHNFLEGPGGSEAPGGIDVEIPISDRGRFLPLLSMIRKGTRVNVCGFWVADMHMLWNELHPIVSLSILPPAPVDATPPVITSHVSGTLGNNGWYTSDVTVTWTVSDPDSPVTSTSGCGPTTIATDTGAAGVALTCSATNSGGSSADGVTIRRDTTSPTIAFAVAPASPDGAHGWYVGSPTVTFSCSDGGSGISSCVADGQSGPSVTLGQSASAQTVGGTATDAAGNVRHGTSSSLFVDLSDPTISAATDRPANADGWFNAGVTVTFTCADAISGVAACAASSTFGEGANQLASGGVTDNAGRSATTELSPINVDTTPPVITFSGNAGTYAVDQIVNITCAAADALSGVASTSCANINGLAWSFGLGLVRRLATATDHAGNIGTGSTSFTVIVTEASLEHLITQFFGNDVNGANGLIAKLKAIVSAPNATAKNGQLSAFDNQVDASTGNPLTPAQAALLKQLAAAL